LVLKPMNYTPFKVTNNIAQDKFNKVLEILQAGDTMIILHKK